MREKFYDQKVKILEYNGYECCICGQPAWQLGHCIPQGEVDKYGKEVIYHWNNMLPVCGLYHNSRVNIGNNPAKVKVILELVASGRELFAEQIVKKLEVK